MTGALIRGLLIALVQGSLVGLLAVQYVADERQLPRAWVKVSPDAVSDPVRGRYLHVAVVPDPVGALRPESHRVGEHVESRPRPVTLEARDGHLLAHRATRSLVMLVLPHNRQDETPVLWPPIEYYLPPELGAPADLLEGELWLEVGVPRQGPPRALRAGRLKDGKFVPVG